MVAFASLSVATQVELQNSNNSEVGIGKKGQRGMTRRADAGGGSPQPAELHILSPRPRNGWSHSRGGQASLPLPDTVGART